MTADRSPAKLSSLDTARWKAVTAKAGGVSLENLPLALEFCRENAVRLLIARCPATDLAAAQAMERQGFQLMDTLVYYSRGLAGEMPPDSPGVRIRNLLPGDETGVRQVASRSFAGYIGHYHADPRLDRRECDETYVDWAHRSCLSRDIADNVVVGERAGNIVAFATMRLNDAEEGEGVLFAVAPEAQGQGICRSLMIAAMQWCKARGRARMIISTQVTNLAMQKVWTRLGLEPSSSYYTFHKWF